MIAKFCCRRLATGFILATALSCSFAAELKRLLDPQDLPPYPATQQAASELTHSQEGVRRLLAGVDLSASGGTPEVQALAREVADLKGRLAQAEQNAYRNDPALLLSDLYTEKAHEWVTSKHSHEFNASLKFSSSTGPSKRLREAVDLIDMLLFIELASDAKFYPLFQSAFGAFELIRAKNTNAFSDLYRYERNDKLVGFVPETTRAPASNLPDYLAQLKKRYPKLLAKLDEIKTELKVPADAFAGIVYGELYRLLDGLSQMAVEIRTPDEVRELRDQLRGKIIQLGRARAKAAR